MKLEHFESSDTGRVREQNQDCFGIIENENLFVVADGMGGSAAGDFASRLAVDIILKAYALLNEKEAKTVAKGSVNFDSVEILRLVSSIRLANRAVKDYSNRFPRLAGMGTTVVLGLFDTKNGVVHICSVGDSRAYRLRNGKIEQLTKDHTKIAELLESGKMKQEDVKHAEIKSMLTRAVGTRDAVNIDYRMSKLLPGDIYIFCTDGLNGELEDPAIRDMVLKKSESAKAAAYGLIDAANNAGGKDNTTVSVVKVSGERDAEHEFYKSDIEKIYFIEEDTLSGARQDEWVLKKISRKIKLKVPKGVNDKKIVDNPLYGGAALAVLVLVGALFWANGKRNISNTGLRDFTGKVSGINLEVRSPLQEQLLSFQKTNDNILRLQIIQDWEKDGGIITSPIGDVYISIKGRGGEEFSGISSAKPIQINLPEGTHTVTLKYPGYKIITEKMEYKDSADISLEYGTALKTIKLIIIPEKLEKKGGAK